MRGNQPLDTNDRMKAVNNTLKYLQKAKESAKMLPKGNPITEQVFDSIETQIYLMTTIKLKLIERK